MYHARFATSCWTAKVLSFHPVMYSFDTLLQIVDDAAATGSESTRSGAAKLQVKEEEELGGLDFATD